MKLLLLAALVFIVAAVVVWNIGSRIVGDVVSGTQQSACVDTNPENNEKLQGAISYKTWYGITKTAYDSCDADDNAALKYGCNGKKVTTERIPCSNGCNAAGTACQGTQLNLALLPSLDAAFESAEPGDNIVFNGITLPADARSPSVEIQPLRLKVLATPNASPNASLAAARTCIQFSLSSLGARTFTENVLANADAIQNPEAETNEDTGADESGCYYVASPVLENPNTKEFHTTLETYVDGIARLYERYCTTKIANTPVRISACPLPRQAGSEEAPETSAALKLTIRFGKK